MSITQEIQDKVKLFAKEQAPLYLEMAGKVHSEKVPVETNCAKKKLCEKVSHLVTGDDGVAEAEKEIAAHMAGYMEELIEGGMPEQEAFDRAKEELAVTSVSEPRSSMQEGYEICYESFEHAGTCNALLVNVGSLAAGAIIGGTIGFMRSRRRTALSRGIWAATSIGAFAGALAGIGIGHLGYAFFKLSKRRK